MTKQLTLKDISETLKKIDVCMMTTKSNRGSLESRPMSNNKDVDYNGDSYFFTLENTGATADVKSDPEVCLVYEEYHHLSLRPHRMYICVSGKAELIQDKSQFAAHWVKDLDKWFKDGIDTPGLTLIKVKAHHIKYWDGYESGEVYVSPATQRLAS